MRRNGRSASGGLTAAIVLIGLVFAFLFGFKLYILFIALAVAALVGSISTRNPVRIYGGFFSALWLLILALFFITDSWLWFLVGAALSVLLSTFRGPILNWFATNGAPGLSPQSATPQQYYTPPPAPTSAQHTYQQGYEAAATPQPEKYREGDGQYDYPAQTSQQYEKPQSQYPQQMPPQ